MAEYTRAIDDQISTLLRLHGEVRPGQLAGLSAEDGVASLEAYVRIHASDAPLRFDGIRLTWAAVPAQEAQPTAAPMPSTPRATPVASPVDQILAAPGGRSLLDVQTSGKAPSKLLWWLPFALGLLGGIISWFVMREDNPRAARQMLLAGLAVQVAGACIGAAVVGSMLPAMGGAASSWPASVGGRAAFYYFGTSS